jgi:hypothetical protein
MFPFASQAAQLRSLEKDAEFVEKFNQQLREVCSSIQGNFVARHENSIKYTFFRQFLSLSKVNQKKKEQEVW